MHINRAKVIFFQHNVKYSNATLHIFFVIQYSDKSNNLPHPNHAPPSYKTTRKPRTPALFQHWLPSQIDHQIHTTGPNSMHNRYSDHHQQYHDDKSQKTTRTWWHLKHNPCAGRVSCRDHAMENWLPTRFCYWTSVRVGSVSSGYKALLVIVGPEITTEKFIPEKNIICS